MNNISESEMEQVTEIYNNNREEAKKLVTRTWKSTTEGKLEILFKDEVFLVVYGVMMQVSGVEYTPSLRETVENIIRLTVQRLSEI